MPLRHCFLDMDGVIADFFTSALELHGMTEAVNDWPPGQRDIPHVLGMSNSQFWKPIDKRGAAFWAEFPPYEWTFDLVELIESFCPWTISSSPSLNAECPTGKVLWLQEHFGKSFRDFLIGPQKSLLAQPDTVLIDDSEGMIDRFIEAGGQAILFPQPWNRHHHITDRLAFVEQELKRLADS